MTPTPSHKYEDSLLTGLAIAERISSEWNSGHYQSIAQITSVIHRQCPNMPRSTIFWLAYHTINKSNQLTTL